MIVSIVVCMAVVFLLFKFCRSYPVKDAQKSSLLRPRCSWAFGNGFCFLWNVIEDDSCRDSNRTPQRSFWNIQTTFETPKRVETPKNNIWIPKNPLLIIINFDLLLYQLFLETNAGLLDYSLQALSSNSTSLTNSRCLVDLSVETPRGPKVLQSVLMIVKIELLVIVGHCGSFLKPFVSLMFPFLWICLGFLSQSK